MGGLRFGFAPRLFAARFKPKRSLNEGITGSIDETAPYRNQAASFSPEGRP
jgi:hypothetical protein